MSHHICDRFIRRPLTRYMFLVLIGLALTVSIATPALAASGPPSTQQKPLAQKPLRDAATAFCGGNSCNGLDPYQSGCARSFYTVAAVTTSVIRVELEYSPLCQTNWTQGYWLDHVARPFDVTLDRLAGQDGPEWFDTFWSDASWWINGNQVYAPHNHSVACLYTSPSGSASGLCTPPT